ncbi:MAG: HipA N-terminal domain-containing protein [Chthoniobacterales bacterium]|nr:HipA N-terminal domain-containing protein [Chthoniobacterales bacterium]
MKLGVYISGRLVAILEELGDFKSVLTYQNNVTADDFVSLTMPVRTESWLWNDSLHPIFRMNFPEDYCACKWLAKFFSLHILKFLKMAELLSSNDLMLMKMLGLCF